MISNDLIKTQIKHVLEKTEFSNIGERYQGKVRDTYRVGDKRILITTDRLSCFDVVVTTIPWKGAVLNALAVHWLNLTKNIIPNHLISSPHPNVMVSKNCKVIPIEVVVRAYLAGSGWRAYRDGQTLSGIRLPAGYVEFSKLEHPMITPSTKAKIGDHDEPISEDEIIAQRIVSAEQWNAIRTAALNLFSFASQEVSKRGLILVDTKFEFGFVDNNIVLVDEIFTLDSSRYWVADSYEKNIAEGIAPQMLDKEPVRRWLLEQGYSGNGPIPQFSDEKRVEIAQHYISSFERITGKEFNAPVGDELQAIERAIAQV